LVDVISSYSTYQI